MLTFADEGRQGGKGRKGGRVNLTKDDQGEGVVRQMLAIYDGGGGGIRQMLTIADEGGGWSKKILARILFPHFLFLHILSSAAGKAQWS